MKVPIEISARHIHLCKKDLEILFGKEYSLKKKSDLSQPGEFSARETLTLRSSQKKEIKDVRIIGPLRSKTQVEISITDAFILGTNFQIRKSGDLKNTSGITLLGPKGKLHLKEGLIVPLRHIHIGRGEAKKRNLRNGQKVSVEIKGPRSVIFNNVRVRVADNYKYCLHLDTDEGNAAGLAKKGSGKIICY